MRKEKKILIIGMIIILLLSILTVFVFYSFSESLSNLKRETQALQVEINNKNEILNNIKGQLTNTNFELNQARLDLEEINKDLVKLRSGERYTLHDPSYNEVLNFLFSDRTNAKPYDNLTFNCANYAQEVNNNAEKQGIRCGFVEVNLSEGRHALVAFNTTDKGILYIEPQDDFEVRLEVGKDYWADCVRVPYGYYYERDPTWMIENFGIIW